MLDQLFAARIGPVPLWVIILGGGVLAAIFAPKLLARITGNGNTTGGSASPSLPDTLDPVTGVPYAIESATDPHTGLPVYYSPVATGATNTNASTNAAAPAWWSSLLTTNPNAPNSDPHWLHVGDANTQGLNTLQAIANRFQLRGGTTDLTNNPNQSAAVRGLSPNAVIPNGSYVWVTTSTAQATGYGLPATPRQYVAKWPRNPANQFA